MNGFRAWRAGACDRCHGANQDGLVGPSLLESMKTLSKEDFIKTVRDGRLDKGMVSFSTSKTVMDNIDNLYSYLKGRSDGDDHAREGRRAEAMIDDGVRGTWSLRRTALMRGGGRRRQGLSAQAARC